MNNAFVQAMQSEDLLGENGMPTNSTSGKKLVDLFFKMGGSRQMHEVSILKAFVDSYAEAPLATLRCAFYNRDIRGGQGERRSFKIFFEWLCNSYPEVAIKNLPNVPLFGRWDDVLVAMGTPVEDAATDFILSALKAGDRLCAKWMPRAGTQVRRTKNRTVRWKRHGDELANKLAKAFNLTQEHYRKLLSGNTQVVETLMCKNQWAEINYNHVPSVASHKYRKAFLKHDPDRYKQWLSDLTKPESGAKVNAGAIFPHTIIQPIMYSYSNTAESLQLAEAQWKALPQYFSEENSFITVNDVSGSMIGEPMTVCVALGIYISEHNTEPFQNVCVTFSDRPAFHVLQGSLYDRVRQLMRADWGGSTNLERTFNLILDQCIRHKVPPEEMPKNILILSDMQFNECVRNPSHTAFEMIKDQYNRAGYTMPNVIFWNLRTSIGIPVQYDTNGTALVSGFSPSLMTSLLSGEMSPIKTVLRTIGQERYDCVVL